MVVARQKGVEQVGERSRYLDTCWACNEDDKIQRAVFNQSGVAVGRFELLQNSVAECNRIHQSVKRERILRCARSTEIVNSGSPCQDQVVVRELAAVI